MKGECEEFGGVFFGDLGGRIVGLASGVDTDNWRFLWLMRGSFVVVRTRMLCVL